jgi:pyrroline-5-carboxylate reductase
MKISFIGGGTMGEAIMSALIENGICTAGEVSVSDVSPERRSYLAGKYGVFVTESNRESASRGDIVVMAVKPQNLEEVMSGMSDSLNEGQTVLSIVAGKTVGTLASGLGHPEVVRAMPNTPAQIGLGVTVWTAAPAVTVERRRQVEKVLGVMGEAFYTADESVLDMATAVSGSGPAYFFLFMESLIAAARNTGLDEKLARSLVILTAQGSVEFARRSGIGLAELRRRVTSPGGTPAAALKVFEESGFSGIVENAVTAAFERSKTLGK